MREFKLNDNELLEAEKFIEEHRHKDVEKGAIGGHLTFTPTSIGVAVEIQCDICGKSKNITDYASW